MGKLFFLSDNNVAESIVFIILLCIHDLPVLCHTTGLVCYLMVTAPSGIVVERSPGVREDVGSIPGWVIPKTLEIVLDASLFSAQHLKVRSRI